jgi:hypothetical protein
MSMRTCDAYCLFFIYCLQYIMCYGRLNSYCYDTGCEERLYCYEWIEYGIQKENCKWCPAGSYCPGERTPYIPCSNIGTYYTSIYGQTYCVNCMPGSYVNGLDYCFTGILDANYNSVYNYMSQECIQCKANTASESYYCPDGNNLKSCPTATYTAAGATSCSNCGYGKYLSFSTVSPFTTSCLSCSPGKYLTAGIASTFCYDCSSGLASTNPGSTSCTACGTGMYASSASTCENCVGGTYQSSATAACTACSQCELGKYNTAVMQSSCSSCSHGQYQDEIGKTLCKSCIAGTYYAGSGAISSSACKKCVGNGYSSAASSSCIECGTDLPVLTGHTGNACFSGCVSVSYLYSIY